MTPTTKDLAERLDRLEAMMRGLGGSSDLAVLSKALNDGLGDVSIAVEALRAETDARFRSLPPPTKHDHSGLIRMLAEKSAEAILAERAATSHQFDVVKSGLGSAANDAGRAAKASAEIAFDFTVNFANDFAHGKAQKR